MELDNKKKQRRSRRLRNWFSKKLKEDQQQQQPSCALYETQGDHEIDEYGGDLEYNVQEFDDPCILTNNLRVFVGTWNVAGRSPVGSLAVDLEDWLNLKNAADIYVLGFQEIVPLKTLNVIGAEDQGVATRWNKLIEKTLNKCDDGYSNGFGGCHVAEDPVSNRYVLVASKKMVGVFMSVWVSGHVASKRCVSRVRVSSVACGVMGYLGNKGCVAVSMRVGGTSLCFVAAHLASGEKKGDEVRRNNQVQEIFRRTCFPTTSKQDLPLTILSHDRIFWFGDLNYRLYLEDNLARDLIRKQDWKALQEFDQLQKELDEGGVFEGWKEGNIEFAPTYKYSSSISNRYCGGGGRGGGGAHQSKPWEKQRTPAWCDRILWYGKGVEQLHYIRSESKFSDHRPVSALFSTHIEMNSSSTHELFKFHNHPSTLLHPNSGLNQEDDDEKSTLFSLLTRDIQGCLTQAK